MLRKFTICVLAALIFGVSGAQVYGTEIVVEGIGYPPVKAINATQAMLMARRAAILDGYAKAIAKKFAFGSSEEDEFYFQYLSGFLKGMKITQQSYHQDGSVRVLLTGEPDWNETSKPSRGLKPEQLADNIKNTTLAPTPVSEKEWIKRIEKMVIFTDDGTTAD